MLATGHDRLVFSSTAAVYGEPETTPILEDAKLQPTNPYGESKLLVEQMLRWMNLSHGLKYASLRYFNVAGAVQGYGEAHEPESHLIPLILDVALGRRANIKIFGRDYPTKDGTCVRDYIHVHDLAEAHLLALAALSDAKSRLIYNIGNGQGFTVLEVIDSVRRVTGRPVALKNTRGAKAIPQCWWQARRRSNPNSDGSRSSLNWIRSSPARGSGTSSAMRQRSKRRKS